MYDKLSYEDYFYRVIGSGKHCGQIKGFPHLLGGWCHRLKTECVDIRGYILQTVNEQIFKRQKSWVSDEKGKLVYGGTKEGGDECPPYVSSQDEERRINIVYYVGIAADEPKRIAKHINKKDIILPLVQIGWDEAMCGLEAQYMGLLSPTYTTSLRDGCWFCHNQGVEQLRNLRKEYPDLWRLLLKWDTDSPVTFHADGRTVHDYDKRFSLEDEGKIQIGKGFRWKQVLDSNNENVKSDTAC